jgi:hypothetical protein
MRKLAALLLSLFVISLAALADTPKDTDAQPASASGAPAAAKPAAKTPAKAAKAEKTDPGLAAEIEELRQAIQAQQEQLQSLKEELAKRDRQIDDAREAAAGARLRAAEASERAIEAARGTSDVKAAAETLSSTVNDLKISNESLKTTVAAETAAAKAANQASEEGAASIKFKGITITPGGFLAAESVWRQRSVQADVNTPFTSAPFPNNDLNHISEFNASGRQSRLSFLFEGKADIVKLTGYYELDWLGSCASSNSRQSNSYCMRQRQIWGQAELTSGWMFTGGQMWSLATERKKGLDNRTETPPMTIDAAYNVGFTWARQYGFRVTKNFNDKVWLGLSVENPQTTITTHGSPTEFLVGAPASGGGLLNATDGTGYAANSAPDFIIKAAFEPGVGHYEIFGIVSNFRARTYPCSVAAANFALPAGCGAIPSSALASNNNTTGGGVGVNARFPIIPNKKGELGLHVIGGDGIGRYSAAQIADVTARPDGTLVPIRSGGALGTLELHPSPKLDVYLNYGVEASARAAYTFTNAAAATVPVGFGSPLFNNSGCENAEGLPAAAAAAFTAAFTPNTANGTCTGDIRNIQEATLGFWHKPYQGPRGGIRWGIQYSYFVRNTWSGTGGLPAGTPGINGKAADNMVFSSFRYYIP